LTVDPKEIFELIIKADEKVKYSTAENADVRDKQAQELLVRARDEARAIGNDQLLEHAERRLADLAAEGPGSPG
jgi:hypothetical protein